MFAAQKDVFGSLAGFTGALLGAQLTLFTFIFGNFIGRYSSVLARTVVTHRAVKSVIMFAFVLFASVGFFLLWGYPNTFSSWPSVVGVLSALCLLLSVGIALAGIATEGAILYVGQYFARRVERDTKPPWNVTPGRRWQGAWALLRTAGLDFRHPERLTGFSPPQRGARRAAGALVGLSNAASRALQDGQPESFRACVFGMVLIVRAWTEARKLYLASEDPVFRLLNDHLAIVIRRAAQAPDESLVRDAMLVCGLVAQLSLLIGPRPTFENGRPRSNTVPGVTPAWMGLLTEGFLQTHSLMRSTAASEALNQMKSTAIGAFQIGFYGVATLSYAPELEKLHRLCVIRPDEYHLHLAAEALRDLVGVWLSAIVAPGGMRLDYETEATFSATIKRMGAAQIDVEDAPSLSFNDAVTSLTSKIASDRPILQDLVAAILVQPRTHSWEEGASNKELVSVIGVVTELGSKAIERRQALAHNWAEALFEIGYLALRRETFKKSLLERLQVALFKAWRKLLGGFQRERNLYGWQHPMFGLLGYAMGVCKERPSVALRAELNRSIEAYLGLARACLGTGSGAEETLAYLQLAGAWAAWVGEDDLAVACRDLVAGVPRSSWGFGSSSSRYGHLGFPTIMHADFFLPNLMNIRAHVSAQAGGQFAGIQERVMSDEVLLPFARAVAEARAGLGTEDTSSGADDGDRGDLEP